MESSKPRGGEAWARLASGIEAGIVGGLAMLGLLVSESLWYGHVWWELPNLLGSTFYGPRAFRAGLGLVTLSGLALHFVLTGTLGGLFGLACGGIHQRGRLILLGMFASLGWYNLANATFWPKVNPWVPAASPRPATAVSHVLLGACLGYMGHRQQKTGLSTLAPPVPPPEVIPVAHPDADPVAHRDGNPDGHPAVHQDEAAVRAPDSSDPTQVTDLLEPPAPAAPNALTTPDAIE